MTTPHERTRSVLQTRDFLIELSNDSTLPERIRRDAKFLLRHYPDKSDMVLAGRLEELPNSLAELTGSVFSPPTVD